AGFVAALAAGIPAGARWLRVAQREHYIPGWTTRLAALWYARRPVSIPVAAGVLVLAAVAAAAAVPPLADAAPWLAWAGVAAAALAAMLPVGLRMRGTSSKLAFTQRCIRLAVAWGGLMVVLGAGLTLVLGAGGGAIGIVAAPLVMDLALAIM